MQLLLGQKVVVHKVLLLSQEMVVVLQLLLQSFVMQILLLMNKLHLYHTLDYLKHILQKVQKIKEIIIFMPVVQQRKLQHR